MNVGMKNHNIVNKFSHLTDKFQFKKNSLSTNL